MSDKKDKFDEFLASKQFDVENALGMYAVSYYLLPASGIYEPELIQKLGAGVKSCHIYLIGIVPRLNLKNVREEAQEVIYEFDVLGEQRDVRFPIPDGLHLANENGFWFLTDGSGKRFGPNPDQMLFAFGDQNARPTFEVVYVGQAYGKDGSRHALDRLLKHETLQKIALNGAPDGYKLEILLLEIQPNNQLFTFFNPKAKDKTQSKERIGKGLDKLFETNEHERITLYEASLIRYFQPQYNIEFKNSFPSTNLKVLEDCYDKDFSSLVAEICFDEFPYALVSPAVDAKFYHIVNTDLHSEEERQVFFGMK